MKINIKLKRKKTYISLKDVYLNCLKYRIKTLLFDNTKSDLLRNLK